MHEALASLAFFAFDSDGTFFTDETWEGVTIDGIPCKPKVRSYCDGQGVSLLRAIGIRVCIITNEKDVSAAGVRAVVAQWNTLPSCKKGDWHPVELFEGCGGVRKLVTLQEWLTRHGGELSKCGAMGNDLVDVPMLKAAAFAAAPISAESVIRALCDFVSERPAGRGAVRDVVNYILEARGIDPLTLPFD